MENRNKEIYPVLLHLELKNECVNDEEKRILAKYADASENGTIIRDILIPSDMPLHNLHYAIQRLFGWQNSHLRCFTIEESDFERLTNGKVKNWSQLVGILFQGSPNNIDDYFWDDNYSSGSIKVWLKKKYKGPYNYGGYAEKYSIAKKSIKQLLDRHTKVEVREPFHEYFKRSKDADDSIRILKVAPMIDLTLQELNDSILLENSVNNLLERLEVISVLALPDEKLANANLLKPKIIPINKNVIDKIGIPKISPVTHKITYNYDYGDNWEVEITRITENSSLHGQLEEAKKIVINEHKPVCVYKKGAFVLDDVGGMSGYTNFISTINESDDEEDVEGYKIWAESLGWSNRKVSLKRML